MPDQSPWRVQRLPESPSTNEVAAEAVRRGEPPGLVVVTDHQTAGRGRLDRRWETPAGVALTCSAVVDPGVPDAQWPWLPLAVGVACCEAVEELTGLAPGVKWPNDVLLEERKLAGILVERVLAPGGHPLAVLGIGVNVHQRELPVPTATSLALAGVQTTVEELLGALLARIGAGLGAWRAEGGPGALRASYVRRSVTLGRRVRAELPGGGVLEGRADRLDEHGRLVLTDDAGEPHVVGAGDVVHLRVTS
ncbi:biotin--[acetyl-CoA-carboxylase] ligase [Marmoricola endophyticus]|uniref:biotin--[acetyl-CoA-carboxylase] ligase n=1 Tax=Marmoricola endophyticus TaxID=2040280 RepID=UPI001E60A882|nr:biotin--[acetyl-CoA-carboxylase] ligase [Marmoricola endophyticus]